MYLQERIRPPTGQAVATVDVARPVEAARDALRDGAGLTRFDERQGARTIPVPGSDVRSRGLTDGERSRARTVFGSAIDLDVVVVTRGSLGAVGADRTTGNTVNLGDSDFDGDTMNLTPGGIAILIHELTHVLQFQQGGLGYIPESLWDQLISKIRTGPVDAAYDWRPLDAAGVPWDEWHVEPQAQAVEDDNRELMKRGRDEPFDPALIARLQKYADQMRAGPRA